MSRRPSPPRRPKGRGGIPPVRVLACALTASALLATAACSNDGDDDGGSSSASDIAASPLAEESATPARLTEAGARAALITPADIEDDWTQVKDAATWRDSLLVGSVDVADLLTAKTNAADCQRLLDSLYSDDLLGKPSGASALTGFEEGQSRLLYQVAAYQRADLDASLAWLKSLPVKCDQFTATDSKGGRRTVQVIDSPPPEAGDARQGLRVTVKSTTSTLTLDVAAVRVGTDAITVTAGGLDGGETDSAEQAVKQGTQRLKDVQAGRTPTANPGQFD
ncbi:hypothetical protein ACQEWB_43105 [Streptomyces sp. CA-249302]|uniref:hypothetical protein n=1 Tax=Streptomyces sp. CA-249302 TaxID=3240058 RepID=UPI003D8D1DD6